MDEIKEGSPSEASTVETSEAAKPEPALVTASAGTAATEPAEAEVAPASSQPGDDIDRESIEVESIAVRQKAAQARAASHLPPPPPSIRSKGGTATLGVAGNPKLAQDLMIRKLFTIGPDDILAHLEEHMQAFRFRHLPVVEDRKLIGLITHTDLLRASASLFSARAREQDEIIHRIAAKHIMQREFVTVRPTAPLTEVAVAMWEARAGCVLVTEEDGTLVGILTEADFIRLAHHFLSRA